jgi:PKD repeat protein
MRFQTRLAHAAGFLASVVAVGFQLTTTGPAQAIVARTSAGHTVSYQPTVAQASVAWALAPLSPQTSGAATQSGVYKECASTEATCLAYFGGPVMRTTTLTPIFWEPEGLGLNYVGEYEKEIVRFLADIAADSGKETDFFSVLPQYYDTIGGAHHVANSVTTTSAITDTDPLPKAAGDLCATPYVKTTRPCVQDQGIRAELTSLIEKNSLPTGIGHEYIVFFPPGIDSCFDGGGSETDTNCSGTGYCGYHGTLNQATEKEVEYANEPDNGDPQYRFEFGGEEFESCATKKGLKEAAITLSSTSHEISESVTDPEVDEPALSWYDFHELNKTQYGEVGDMCAYEYSQGEAAGALIGETTVVPNSTSNQTINGHSYLLQTEWDNAHSTCSISEHTSVTRASFTDDVSAPVQTDEQVSVNGMGSFAPVAIENYEWRWGDGTTTTGSSPTAEHAYTSTEREAVRTFRVTLTVTDKNGNQDSVDHTVEIEDRRPSAAFALPVGATAGTPTQFEGSASSDPDGAIAAYEWAFGDDTTATGSSPSHVYASEGEYTVTLTVTDDAGNTSELSHTVTVAPAPPEPPAKTSGTTGGETVTESSSPGGSSAPSGGSSNATQSNLVHVNSVKQNKKKGTVALGVTVPGAGVLSAREASAAHISMVSPLAGALVAPAAYPVALVTSSKGKAKAKGPFIKAVRTTVSAAGKVTVQIVPNAAGSALLKSKHKLALKILMAFTPTGGTQGTLVQPVTLVLSAKKHK